MNPQPFTRPCICSVEKALADMGITVVPYDLPKGFYGLYDHKNRLVYIHTDLDEYQRLETLLHELEHAKAGHDCPQPDEVERAIEQHVAELVVDPQRHARVMERYPDNQFARARALSVSRLTLDAWERAHGITQGKHRTDSNTHSELTTITPGGGTQSTPKPNRW